jgi:hypothetical protein
MIVVEMKNVLPVPGRKAAEPAGLLVTLQDGQAKVLPCSQSCLGAVRRGVNGRNERQEHGDAPVS